MKRTLLLSLIGLLVWCSIPMQAQNDDRVYQFMQTPQGWDNRNFGICWFAGKDVRNIRSYVFCTVSGEVQEVRVNPTGLSFAVRYATRSNKPVAIYSYENGSVKHSFRSSDPATAVAYSPNAKHLAIAYESRVIRFYNTSDYKIWKMIPTAFVPQQFSISPNEFYVAAPDDQMLYVWNLETGKMRKIIELEHTVNYVSFSPNSAKMAVATDNNEVLIYDTKTFTVSDTYTDVPDARECLYHPDGKYLVVLTGNDEITIINTKNPTDRQVIKANVGNVRRLGYSRSSKNEIHLVYNDGAKLIFHPMDDLTPDYQQIISLEVEEKMDEWLKQMPGESLEDYHLRVNEETRAAQYSQFENDVATDIAGDRVQQAEVTFGSYNQEQNMLEINFDNMPEIYLNVPQEDVAEFSRPEKLTFENSVYGVTEDDKFELLYTEVINTETGKKYVFDNLEKQSLSYLANDDYFVPLELIQQSSMEEVKLQEIREEVVAAAQEASLISEHTHIDVKTKVENAINADGEKIVNYAVEFHYDVEQEFSAKEDFKAGKYIIEQSESAMAMLRIVQNAFENEFKQYLRPDKKVLIRVTGSADAAPVNRRIPYTEEYGAYSEELVYIKGEPNAISVSASTGINTNEQLAFLRAMGVKDYVQRHIPALKMMNTDYEVDINVSEERGTQFRRIGVKFIFIDAF